MSEKRPVDWHAFHEEERRQGDLVRRVRLRPEFDCHDGCAFDKPTCKGKGSGGWHGIGSRSIFWSVAVIGQGAVSLNLHSNIYTENALLRGGPGLARIIAEGRSVGALDLHYGSPPDYLADYGPNDCDLIDGKCWGDVSYMAADEGYEALVLGGTEGVWSWLAESWLPDVVGASGSEEP